MDFVSCLTKHPLKSCCDRETAINSELGSCDHIYASLIECKNKGINEDFVYLESVSIGYPNKRNEDSRKKRASSPTNSNTCQPSLSSTSKISSRIDKESKEITHSSYNLLHDADFQCPRCGQRMEEPRLLPCLHPICLLCVYQLMNKPSHIFSKSQIQHNRMYARADIHEICPLCDSRLPNVNSPVPPPHYPLQHRLIINTVRDKLVNRILCDTCVGEVLALIQCSTCLRNFCSECGRRHEQQNVAEARATKHLMRPLWEATKVRRTILCQRHPTHILKFYCIACQQVTCKECMWSMQHRGHASEDAVGVGKRATAYLGIMLQKAKIILNTLLIQYDRNIFSSNALDELQDIKTCRYVQI